MPKAGQPIGSKNLETLGSLQILIYGLLRNEYMTTKELINCLMSEPYNMKHENLGLVVVVLQRLNEADDLKVRFRVNSNILDLESRFSTV